MPITKNNLEEFIQSSNDVIQMKLVRKESDFEDSALNFKPVMSHQVYGETENIFGYKGLEIKLYHTAGHLTPFVAVNYDQKVSLKAHKVEADDVMKPLSEILQQGFLTNSDKFLNSLSKEPEFKPFGELKHRFSITDELNVERQFEIYICSADIPGFVSFHERLQSFLLWFVDAASFIEIDDPKWRFFVCYEKYKNVDEKDCYAVMGYSTVYQYYAFPNGIRPRISQFLILPPFQRKGIGLKLLETIYQCYKGDCDVLDITAEDPSEDFQRLRDVIDCKSCMKLPNFSASKLKQGFTEDMIKEAKTKFKINKRQARRIYEILRMYATDLKNKEEYTNYRLDVKQRLNIPFKKEKREMERLAKVLTPNELQATVACSGAEQKMECLENQYRELEEQYKLVIDRLAQKK